MGSTPTPAASPAWRARRRCQRRTQSRRSTPASAAVKNRSALSLLMSQEPRAALVTLLGLVLEAEPPRTEVRGRLAELR